jgi:hypothetical protein
LSCKAQPFPSSDPPEWEPLTLGLPTIALNKNVKLLI